MQAHTVGGQAPNC